MSYRIPIPPYGELQIGTARTPAVVAIVNKDDNIGNSAQSFGEPLVPGETYVIAPYSLTSISTLTGAELDCIGAPDFVEVTDRNKDSLTRLINLTTSLNRIRFGAFSGIESRGPNVLLVGPPRTGKSTSWHALGEYAQRSGWRPVMYRLDPSGRSSLTGLDKMPGLIVAEVSDRMEDPAAFEALLQRAESANSGERLDILREWCAPTEAIGHATSPSGRGKRRRHGAQSEARHKALSLISSIARREAVGLSEGNLLSVNSTDLPGMEQQLTASTLTEWERISRPLAPTTDSNLQEDSMGVWVGHRGVDSETWPLLLHGTELLKKAVEAKFYNGECGRIYHASGAIIDCPASLTPRQVAFLTQLLEIDLILLVGETDASWQAALAGDTIIRERKTAISEVPSYECTWPMERRTDIMESMPKSELLETVRVPRWSPEDPSKFMNGFVSGDFLTTPYPCNSPIPLPARLLRVPMVIPLFVSGTFQAAHLCVAALKVVNESVTAVLNATVPLSGGPGCLVRVPDRTIRVGGTELKKALLSTTCSSPAYVRHSQDGVVVHCREGDLGLLSARSVVLCVMGV